MSLSRNNVSFNLAVDSVGKRILQVWAFDQVSIPGETNQQIFLPQPIFLLGYSVAFYKKYLS